MNVNDGTIVDGKELTAALKDNPFVSIRESDMTPKQRREKKVSLHDRVSKLGKRLTHERKKRKIGRNETCPCGSGLKFKKCCINYRLNKI